MNLIEDAASEPGAHEYPKWRTAWNRAFREVWTYRLRRWLPRLVWLGDELDVQITWIADKPEEGQEPSFGLLFNGGIYEIESQLHHMGIGFDAGIGRGGRDWEWDWLLSGPVRVKFRGRAKHPERRVSNEPTRPALRIIE